MPGAEIRDRIPSRGPRPWCGSRFAVYCRSRSAWRSSLHSLRFALRKEEEASLIASRKKCKHTIQSLAIALHWYLAANKSFPAATWSNPDLEPENRLSWFALILPQLDRRNLYDAVDSAKPWNVGQNDVVAHTHLPIASCPNLSTPEPGSSQPASFVGIAGLGTDAPALPKSDARAGVFGCDRKTTLADITDGPANTMLLAETARVSGSWLQGGPATVRGLDPAAKPYVGAARQFGGIHGEGAWVAMADGSVRWVEPSIDPKVLEALSTMAGGERLPADW